MMRRPLAFALAVPCGLLVSACESGPKAYPLEKAPAELAEPVAKAQAAIDTLQARLVARLGQELEKGGALGAVDVCRDEAQAITAEVQTNAGIAVGRTSHRLRNPSNAPRDWVKPLLEQAVRTGTIEPTVVVLGGSVGVVRPIHLGAPCLHCHGDPQAIAPEVLAALREAYPEDQATGFAEGELRGLFWAEVPTR